MVAKRNQRGTLGSHIAKKEWYIASFALQIASLVGD